MHWANYDQYYIKTSEDFNNYSFNKNNITVNFNAEVDKNNNKSDEDRYFVLKEKDYLNYDDKLKILNIYFEYRNLASKEKKKYKTRNTQADIREYIEKDISNKIKKDSELFQDLSWLLSDNNKVKSILAKHLYKYTIKNKSD